MPSLGGGTVSLSARLGGSLCRLRAPPPSLSHLPWARPSPLSLAGPPGQAVRLARALGGGCPSVGGPGGERPPGRARRLRKGLNGCSVLPPAAVICLWDSVSWPLVRLQVGPADPVTLQPAARGLSQAEAGGGQRGLLLGDRTEPAAASGLAGSETGRGAGARPWQGSREAGPARRRVTEVAGHTQGFVERCQGLALPASPEAGGGGGRRGRR